MNRITILILSAVLGIIVLLAVVLMLVNRTSPQVFVGARALDLGVKEIHGEPAVFTGEFSLRNEAGTAVHVLMIRPSCGCLQAQLPRTVIPAGEDLKIPFVMTLERHGVKDVNLDVVLPEEHIERLTVRAEAREIYHLTLAPQVVLFKDDQPQKVMVYVEVFDGENPPPSPRIDAPVGLEVAFAGWEKLDARNAGGVDSQRWRSELSLMRIDDAAFSDALLTVAVGEKDSQAVRLRAVTASPE